MVKKVSYKIVNNNKYNDVIVPETIIEVNSSESLNKIAEKLGFDPKTGFKNGKYDFKKYVNNSNNTMLIIHFV
jgi:hypothetical protein